MTTTSYLNPPPLAFSANRLEGRVIFITGASSGIGEAAVKLFAKEGAKVVASARRLDRLKKLATEAKQQRLSVMPIECDVLEEDSIVKAIAATMKEFGRLDGAFNNSGFSGHQAPLHEASVEEFDQVIATNLRGVFLCLKHEIRAMLQTGGGSIVNNSSVAGLKGFPGMGIYSASKTGLTGLTRCAALECARKGIRVNCIAPGPTRSEMFDNWMPTEEARTGLAELVPMNYIAHPEDMARAALFLLSDESRWTTGATLPCEGGFSA